MRWIWLAVATGWAVVAQAREIAVVGAHDPALSADDQVAVVEALRVAVEASGDASVLGPGELVTRLGPRVAEVRADAVLAEGRRRLAEARAVALAEGAEAAGPLLDAAEALLDADAPFAGTVDGVREAAWGRAEVAFAAGDEVAARAAVAAAAAWQPGWKPPAGTPAPLLSWWTEAVRAQRTATVALTVTAVGDGAEAWVDGVPVGAVPAQRAVVRGPHWVTVRAGGQTGAQRVVAVGDPLEATVAVGPPSLGPQAATVAERVRRTDDLYDALRRAAGVDAVLLVGVVGGAVQAQLVTEAGALQPARVDGPLTPARAAEAAVAALAATRVGPLLPVGRAHNPVLAGLLVAPPPAVPVPVTGVADDASVDVDPDKLARRKKAVKLGIGIGVGVLAAAVIGAAAGLSASQPVPADLPVGTITVARPRSAVGP